VSAGIQPAGGGPRRPRPGRAAVAAASSPAGPGRPGGHGAMVTVRLVPVTRLGAGDSTVTRNVTCCRTVAPRQPAVRARGPPAAAAALTASEPG
jgi:hypothetical protein